MDKVKNRSLNGFIYWGFALMALSIPDVSQAALTACPADNTATRLTCEFGNFIDLAVTIGYLIGSIMLVLAGFFIYLSQRNPNQYGTGMIISSLLAGTFFLGFSNVVTLYQSVTFGETDLYNLTDYNSSIQRIKGVDSGGGIQYLSNETMQAIIGFVKLVGVIAMLRSVYLIYEAGKGARGGNSTYGQIIVFAIGGSIAFRIEDFTCMLAELFNMPSICLLGS